VQAFPKSEVTRLDSDLYQPEIGLSHCDNAVRRNSYIVYVYAYGMCACHVNFCVEAFVRRKMRVTFYTILPVSCRQINNDNAALRDSIYRVSVRLVCIISHIGKPLNSL